VVLGRTLVGRRPDGSAADELEAMLPYAFLAVLGKRVIHPGGRASTGRLYEMAEPRPGQRVLEVGCGVGTTAIELARRFHCRVTAVDLDPFMVGQALANVRSAGLEGRVSVQQADLRALPYPDQTFDRVVVEAVLEFLPHQVGAREIVRVCRAGGRVADHEFTWRAAPPAEVRALFEEQVCPPSRLENWPAVYEAAGLSQIKVASGRPTLMTVRGFLRDEGLANSLAVVARTLGHRPYLRKMSRLMHDMGRIMPYLDWVTVAGERVP
jgi:SAM-dependent methyltransferase